MPDRRDGDAAGFLHSRSSGRLLGGGVEALGDASSVNIPLVRIQDGEEAWRSV
jgi:hypothetical protein